jgi:hypothetical protein
MNTFCSGSSGLAFWLFIDHGNHQKSLLSKYFLSSFRVLETGEKVLDIDCQFQ